MSNIDEIRNLEEQLRQAELGPDPDFFDRVLADDAVLDGELMKQRVVEVHRPGSRPKFTEVEMSGFRFFDHGSAVVVTCTGRYEGPQSVLLKFMRVWLRKAEGWQIIAATTVPA